VTVFCLEMRSTQDWSDVRYREYTSSRSRAEAFQKIKKIQFTDSGHGVVPVMREHTGRRELCNNVLRQYVQEQIAKVKDGDLEGWAKIIAGTRLDLSKPPPCPSCNAATEHWWSYCAMCGYHIASGALTRPESTDK
jgi:hypothetical protein